MKSYTLDSVTSGGTSNALASNTVSSSETSCSSGCAGRRTSGVVGSAKVQILSKLLTDAIYSSVATFCLQYTGIVVSDA